jgi:hypothetical protein
MMIIVIDGIVEKLVTLIANGGNQGIISMLLVVIALLLFDRHRLNKEIGKKDDKLESIIDDYYKGNLTLAEALNSLKFVLFEIKTKL